MKYWFSWQFIHKSPFCFVIFHLENQFNQQQTHMTFQMFPRSLQYYTIFIRWIEIAPTEPFFTSSTIRSSPLLLLMMAFVHSIKRRTHGGREKKLLFIVIMMDLIRFSCVKSDDASKLCEKRAHFEMEMGLGAANEKPFQTLQHHCTTVRSLSWLIWQIVTMMLSTFYCDSRLLRFMCAAR